MSDDVRSLFGRFRQETSYDVHRKEALRAVGLGVGIAQARGYFRIARLVGYEAN